MESANLRLLEMLLDQGECAWVEFKESWYDAQKIGRYASALANGARIDDKPYGYVVWGISDEDHSVVGTSLKLSEKKVGQQPLELWLKQRLTPKGHPLRFLEFLDQDGSRIVLMEVGAAQVIPIRFDGIPYVRIGSTT